MNDTQHMIIGIDASRANTKNRSGTEWYSWHVIQELKAIIPAEHTVRLYVKEALRDDMMPFPSNWEVRVLQWPPKLLWTQLRLSFEMLLHPPDVLYVPAHTIPVIAPKNTVTVIHDVGFFTNPELYSASELRYHRFSFWLAVKKAKQIITISDFSSREIIKIAPQIKTRLHRIYNGLHTRTAEPDHGILHRFNLVPQSYLLMIGRVEQKKNALRLAQAFIELCKNPDFQMKLVFAGDLGHGAEDVMHALQEHDLTDRIIFTGYLPDAGIVALLENARLFVFPSLYEGFGMPVLEAMEKRVPVICSAIEPLQEIVDGHATLFDPHDVTAIAKVIAESISNPENISIPTLDAAQKHAQIFSWKQTAEATWQIIQRLFV